MRGWERPSTSRRAITEPAQAAFARALEISAAERDAGLELRTLAYATSVDHFDLRWSTVLAKSRRILELARYVDDPRSETYARYRAAFALMQAGHADEAAVESDANLALAEQLKDRGLLADALYVKNTLAQLKGEWREARAYSDRALALSPHQLPFIQIRLLLECETGHRKAGNAYLERIMAAERRAGPWPWPRNNRHYALANRVFVERQHELRRRAPSVTRCLGEATGSAHGTDRGACRPRTRCDLQIEA